MLLYSEFLRSNCDLPDYITKSYIRTSLESVLRQSALVHLSVLHMKRGRPTYYSPLLFGWVYRVASLEVIRQRESPEYRDNENLQLAIQVLQVLQPRWGIAGS